MDYNGHAIVGTSLVDRLVEGNSATILGDSWFHVATDAG